MNLGGANDPESCVIVGTQDSGLEAALRSLPGRCAGCLYDVKHQGCRCVDGEWSTFVTAIRAAAVGGIVHQRNVRPMIRGRIEPKHIGQQYARAIREGLLVEGSPERSDDSVGKNAGRWEPSYELRSTAA
jgi:hypothetical protein